MESFLQFCLVTIFQPCHVWFEHILRIVLLPANPVSMTHFALLPSSSTANGEIRMLCSPVSMSEEEWRGISEHTEAMPLAGQYQKCLAEKIFDDSLLHLKLIWFWHYVFNVCVKMSLRCCCLFCHRRAPTQAQALAPPRTRTCLYQANSWAPHQMFHSQRVITTELVFFLYWYHWVSGYAAVSCSFQ